MSPGRQRPHLVLIALLFAIASPIPASAYYEDSTAAWAGWAGNTYSSFHYELTRKLALGAGFTVSEAELIASVDEAVDVGTFRGEFSWSPLVVLSGTPRFGDLHTFYHFPRRGLTDASGNPYPSGVDSCSYFTAATGDVCPGGVPEIDTLDRWAVLSAGEPSPVPTLSVNGSAAAPVAGGSLHALAIYLHSLADSYSHEECMRLVQKRDHTLIPPAACQLGWHDLEYGPDPPSSGRPYTRFAGRAVWGALLHYRQAHGLTASGPWDTATASAFVDSWSALAAAADRRTLASPVPGFFALPPCRVVDTRDAARPQGLGPPVMAAGEARTFSVASICGIPQAAAALVVNVTATDPGAAGHFALWAAGSPPPGTSTVNFSAGRTRANNSCVLLGPGASFQAANSSGAPANLVVDVVGYLSSSP